MEIKSEHEFKLNVPVKYHSGGDHHEGSLIILKAPSNKVRAQRGALKQAFMQSIREAEDNTKVTVQTDGNDDTVIQDNEIADYILMMLYSSKTIKIATIIEEFKQLLTVGKCALVEGEVPMNALMFDEMDADDCDRMMGEYMANFILASFLNKIQSK